jgi:hypothetical protein
VTIRLGKGIGVEVFESQEPGLDYRNLAIEFVRERDVAWSQVLLPGFIAIIPAGLVHRRILCATLEVDLDLSGAFSV